MNLVLVGKQLGLGGYGSIPTHHKPRNPRVFLFANCLLPFVFPHIENNPINFPLVNVF
jgi:hypothetical protein